MADTTNHKFDIRVPEFVSTGLETGRARFRDLETQAQDVLKDLYSRGNREIEGLRERLPIDTLKERMRVEEIVDRARDLETKTRSRATEVADDLEERLGDLQGRILGLVGVASREQVESLAKDIERLAKRVDRLAREARPKPARPAAKKAPVKKTASRPKRKGGGR